MASFKTSPPDFKGALKPRSVAAYMLLPRILPRLGDLFFTGFYFFAFFMAQVYRGVRLLPEGHPTLNPANIGAFGVRDVISAATGHLVWRKENIDQILVYIAILVGLALLLLQALTFLAALAMPQAMAQTYGFASMFGQPVYPQGAKTTGSAQDIAFILLDRVFGVPGIFNSCISLQNTPCYGVAANMLNFDTKNTVYKPGTFPWPFHDGLHALFQFYSMGLLIVAVFILIYLVIVIVAETAQTGTPFGKRFNTVWAPIRLVMAFGLLIPVSYGLNSAQYITLYAAKWGSNFATNGWLEFNKAMSGSAKGLLDNLTVTPNVSDTSSLLQFMTLTHACKVYEESYVNMGDAEAAELQQQNLAAKLKSQANAGAAPAAGSAPTAAASANPAATNKPKDECGKDATKGRKIEAYLVKVAPEHSKSFMFLNDVKNYDVARKFAENGDITVRFGDMDCDRGAGMAAQVFPDCGEISLKTSSLSVPGALAIQEGYFDLIKHLWGGYGGTGTSNDGIKTYFGEATATEPRKSCTKAAADIAGSGGDKQLRLNALAYFQRGTMAGTGICPAGATGLVKQPDPSWMDQAKRYYMEGDGTDYTDEDVSAPATTYNGGNSNVIVSKILDRGVQEEKSVVNSNNNPYTISPDNMARGWAAAGIWYNKIAEMNGALIGAAWDMPMPTRYPRIMELVVEQKRQNNPQVDAATMFNPAQNSEGLNLPLGDSGTDYAKSMNDIYIAWGQSQATVQPSTGNVFTDTINFLFGTKGLFDLRSDANKNVHPLAQLVGVGRSLIEASIRNIGLGVGFGLGSAGAAFMGLNGGAEALTSMSTFMFSIVTMTLTAGFVLFYIIPFMPFLYFFFAVGSWIKGIFEAMVGVPLWALAHLRIDGNGLPGEAAINGYFMIFEIFLRPILIVFGLLASITVFGAMASVLHEIFDTAINNLTGATGHTGATQAIDKLFYTIMYAAIMYMLGMSSFKLIDLIPNQMMRWLGTNVSTFSDSQSDPAAQLTGSISQGGMMVMGQVQQGMSGAMGGLKSGAAGLRGLMPK